ncbi:hypothetical protein BED46_027525 [Burkholderia contaminans]|jgi:hypothetical protein|nr:hypothetical protein WR31_25385 [Burkholderia contaminans LMG 23361]MBA9831118.1 hypothetical protein [Burkholderia contaminans]MBA9839176.1 hypothetical protein [Burkholderia contaminans]MBA9864486.1 hypothetical protein [Burkholderia contaminans]MBA9906758.1 hypothetical protein [Burkholderia contaminans]
MEYFTYHQEAQRTFLESAAEWIEKTIHRRQSEQRLAVSGAVWPEASAMSKRLAYHVDERATRWNGPVQSLATLVCVVDPPGISRICKQRRERPSRRIAMDKEPIWLPIAKLDASQIATHITS